MQRTARLAGVLIGSAVLLGAMTTSASASEPPEGPGFDHRWTTTDTPHGGTVYITEHGDVVEVCDTAADGKTPYVELWWDHGGYEIGAPPGYGHCATHSADDGYNITENEEVTVLIGLGDDLEYGSEHHFLNDH